MDTCPKCHRKLLSHASKCCNWCGEAIEDPEYQQSAEANRAAYYQHDRLEAAIETARVDAINAMPVSSLGYTFGGFPSLLLSRRFQNPMPPLPPANVLPAQAAPPFVPPPDHFAAQAARQEDEQPTRQDQETADRAKHIEF